MSSRTVTNVLLSVIAVCLLLGVGKLYGVRAISDAHAQTASPAVIVDILGCYLDAGKGECQWRPIRVNEYGQVLTANK